ncbi:PIN domain-containing protein [Methylomonas lenta]|uniref:hypothetical protein n=1 Tax=Methylomonas lenta TaxID=980561 RepID=UPI000AE7FF88|nr:hypothetical protein [Methylomonas lenta]
MLLNPCGMQNDRCRHQYTGSIYVDDPNDPEATKQHPIAHRILTGSEQLFWNLEWVLRTFYRFEASDFRRVVEHLLGLTHVNVEECRGLRKLWHYKPEDWILQMLFIIPPATNANVFIALTTAVLHVAPLD